MNRVPGAIKAGWLLILVGCNILPDTNGVNSSADIHLIGEEASEVIAFVEGRTDSLRDAPAGPSNAPVALFTQAASEMRERNGELSALKKTGAVGENIRGLVELVRAEVLDGSEEVNAAQRLIAAENENRKALYQEVARVNSAQNVRVATVEGIYAHKRLERAQRGELFQMPLAGEDFEAFKQTTAGEKLGSACVPGAWATIR